MAEPYGGYGAIGGYFAGLHTPETTEISPELEAQLRRHYSEALALLSNSTTKLQMEVLESHSNLGVAYAQAMARTIGAAAQMAQAGAAGKQASAMVLGTLPGLSARIDGVLGGISVDPKFDTKVAVESQELGRRLAAVNTTLLESIEGQTPEQAANTIREAYGKAIYDGPRNNLSSGANAILQGATRGDAYRLKRNVVANTNRVANESLSRLVRGIEDGGLRSALLQPGVGENLAISSTELGLTGAWEASPGVVQKFAGGRDLNFAIQPGEEAIHNREYQVMGEEARKVLELAYSGTAGLDPGLVARATEALTFVKELGEQGPEAYAAKVSAMPLHMSAQLAEQTLLEGLESLDPRDPLTEEVAKYAATVPYFYTWAAAMGFDTGFQAVRYAVRNPDSINVFLRIAKESPEAVQIPATEVPHELAGRLRQEGIYRTRGPFKTKFLNKKIERLLGFGLVPTGGYKSFPGETTEEQLQSAVNFANQGLQIYKDAEQEAQSGKERKEIRGDVRSALGRAILGEGGAPLPEAETPGKVYTTGEDDPYEYTFANEDWQKRRKGEDAWTPIGEGLSDLQTAKAWQTLQNLVEPEELPEAEIQQRYAKPRQAERLQEKLNEAKADLGKMRYLMTERLEGDAAPPDWWEPGKWMVGEGFSAKEVKKKMALVEGLETKLAGLSTEGVVALPEEGETTGLDQEAIAGMAEVGAPFLEGVRATGGEPSLTERNLRRTGLQARAALRRIGGKQPVDSVESDRERGSTIMGTYRLDDEKVGAQTLPGISPPAAPAPPAAPPTAQQPRGRVTPPTPPPPTPQQDTAAQDAAALQGVLGTGVPPRGTKTESKPTVAEGRQTNKDYYGAKAKEEFSKLASGAKTVASTVATGISPGGDLPPFGESVAAPFVSFSEWLDMPHEAPKDEPKKEVPPTEGVVTKTNKDIGSSLAARVGGSVPGGPF